jgi:putative hydrolases of HD superfamily
MNDRLAAQLRFIVEIDKLKRITRQTYLTDRSRKENSAEHSWHMALTALLLHEYAAEEGVDLFKVVQMALVHDLVEIDAGDALVYDEAARRQKAKLEQAAAARIFALLPPDQGQALRSLWEEFEAHTTPEARFAAAIDRFQPILHNYYTDGAAWREHGITADRVLAGNRHMAQGAPALWAAVQDFIRDAVARGFLAPPAEDDKR